MSKYNEWYFEKSEPFLGLGRITKMKMKKLHKLRLLRDGLHIQEHRLQEYRIVKSIIKNSRKALSDSINPETLIQD